MFSILTTALWQVPNILWRLHQVILGYLHVFDDEPPLPCDFLLRWKTDELIWKAQEYRFPQDTWLMLEKMTAFFFFGFLSSSSSSGGSYKSNSVPHQQWQPCDFCTCESSWIWKAGSLLRNLLLCSSLICKDFGWVFFLFLSHKIVMMLLLLLLLLLLPDCKGFCRQM